MEFVSVRWVVSGPCARFVKWDWREAARICWAVEVWEDIWISGLRLVECFSSTVLLVLLRTMGWLNRSLWAGMYVCMYVCMQRR